VHHTGCARTSTESICEKPMSCIEGATCAFMPPSKNVVCLANHTSTPSTHAADSNSMQLVHLAGRHLPNASYHTPATQRSRWLGTAGHRSEMQNAYFKPHVDAPFIRRISNSGMDAKVAADRHSSEPSTRKQVIK